MSSFLPSPKLLPFLLLIVCVVFLAAKPVQAAPQAKTIIYTVRMGDTLSGLAWRYGTTVSAIKSKNGLKSSTIYIGQRLRIPVGVRTRGSTTIGACPSRYRVQRNDTLSAIARRCGTAVARIMALNGLKNANYIRAGQVLVLAGASRQPVRTVTPKATPTPTPHIINLPSQQNEGGARPAMTATPTPRPPTPTPRPPTRTPKPPTCTPKPPICTPADTLEKALPTPE